jgi:undecaprenyl-diphosphatase
MVYRSDMSKNKKIICSTVLGLVIFLIGLSRIYLGVHFASDVLGGFALSLAYLILFIKLIYKRYESK